MWLFLNVKINLPKNKGLNIVLWVISTSPDRIWFLFYFNWRHFLFTGNDSSTSPKHEIVQEESCLTLLVSVLYVCSGFYDFLSFAVNSEFEGNHSPYLQPWISCHIKISTPIEPLQNVSFAYRLLEYIEKFL